MSSAKTHPVLASVDSKTTSSIIIPECPVDTTVHRPRRSVRTMPTKPYESTTHGPVKHISQQCATCTLPIIPISVVIKGKWQVRRNPLTGEAKEIFYASDPSSSVLDECIGWDKDGSLSLKLYVTKAFTFADVTTTTIFINKGNLTSASSITNGF